MSSVSSQVLVNSDDDVLTCDRSMKKMGQTLVEHAFSSHMSYTFVLFERDISVSGMCC